MKIEIHSIQSLKRRAHKPFAPETALISIGDFGTELPSLEYKPAHILRLEFDDVTLSEIDYESSGRYAFRLFSEDQANQIADFVYRYWESCGTLLCQCHYGQSRSAAWRRPSKSIFTTMGLKFLPMNRNGTAPTSMCSA